jgi:molybdopterin molybdotransferase
MTERELPEAFAEIAARLTPVEGTQPVTLAGTGDALLGRVLARAVVAPLDLPTLDQAAMDGYAVRSQDLAPGSNRLRVAGRVLAGQFRAEALEAGTCVRIMTGAPMPAGSDAVVVIEAVTSIDADRVVVPGPIAAGANRRRKGEHVRAGETVLRAGKRLGSVDLALACALGLAELELRRPLRVGVLSTGDELRDPPAPLPPGGAYDSNRPMMAAALARAAMAVTDLSICPDDPAALAAVIDRAFDQALDAVVLSGGAALGDADIVRSLGGVSFVPVNLRPGRGIAVAQLARGQRSLLVLGLPGNAVAAFVLLHLLALPLLQRLAGADAGLPEPVAVPLAADQRTRAGRVDYRRARLVRDGAGRIVAQPLAEQGSAMIRSLCEADALIALGPAPQSRAGELVPAYLLSALGER